MRHVPIRRRDIDNDSAGCAQTFFAPIASKISNCRSSSHLIVAMSSG